MLIVINLILKTYDIRTFIALSSAVVSHVLARLCQEKGEGEVQPCVSVDVHSVWPEKSMMDEWVQVRMERTAVPGKHEAPWDECGHVYILEATVWRKAEPG